MRESKIRMFEFYFVSWEPGIKIRIASEGSVAYLPSMGPGSWQLGTHDAYLNTGFD